MSESSEELTIHEAIVLLPAHLHARPAGALVQAAAKFQSTVEVVYGDRSANARGVLAVMSLGALAGTCVLLRATGPDAEEAVATLAGVLATAQ